jgi:phenylalanyl-tRNA synthetase beta chain
MLVSLNWLKEFLDTNAKAEEISKTLTAIGLEVENVREQAAGLQNFKMAFIEHAETHPNADRLRVCQVFTGSETVQIVCGAPNARAGILVVMAPVGAVIPANGLVIKKSNIRGVESNGMLCSAAELGLSGDGEGILEFNSSKENAGKNFIDFRGLNDVIFEIAITPNRADALGVYGVARDLAAAGIGQLKNFSVPKNSADFISDIKIENSAPHLCPLFLGREIRAVNDGESPEWLKQRLEAVGLRSKSLLVDISNYVCLAYARPNHIYDADLLRRNAQTPGLLVRVAEDGEKFFALGDEKNPVELSAGMLVIDALKSDADSGVQAVAGVMGGQKSACSTDGKTKNIFLEVALFDAVSIAQTGRSLGINSDSRFRFERGVDPDFAVAGMEILTQLILQLCGGSASELIVVGEQKAPEKIIPFQTADISRLAGLEVEEKKAREILEKLGFVILGDEKNWQVKVPSWRMDVAGNADLVEEILRVIGYDAIPDLQLPQVKKNETETLSSRFLKLRHFWAQIGGAEIVSWSFMDERKVQNFALHEASSLLANPISSELNYLRPSILPNLLDVAKRNMARGFADLSLFEVGPVFTKGTPDARSVVGSFLRCGAAVSRNIHGNQRKFDVFDAKADLLLALEKLGVNISSATIENLPVDVAPYLHPGQKAGVRLGKNWLGYFGSVHPKILQQFDIENCAVFCELFLDNLPPIKSSKRKVNKPFHASLFQASVRDFAFVVEEKISAAELLKAVQKVDVDLIQDVSLFDCYRGKGVEEGCKSLAISVRLQADRNLTEVEIDSVSQKIIAAVAEKCGGVLR